MATESIYRAETRVAADGSLILKDTPFAAGEKVEVVVRSASAAAIQKSSSSTADASSDALSVLEALAGTVEAPVDWSAEHDHYLYGTAKRGGDQPG